MDPIQPLDVRILPRAPRCGFDLLDAEGVDALIEGRAVDVVAIAEQEARRIDARERLDHLLRRPPSRGVGGHMEVKNSAAMMHEDEEDEEDLVL